MIIDAHVHIFSRKIREDRARHFPSEPAFKLLYDSPKSRIVGADDVVDMMDENGVDRSVVFGFPWRDAEVFRRENDYILEAVGRHPDRLAGLCCFDAINPEAPQETERCLKAGLAGVGELAFYVSGIDRTACDALDPVMALCREHRAPILIHTNEPVGHVYPGKSPNTLTQIYEMVKRFPDNKIILAHWGGGIFLYTLLKKEVREVLKNVWYDTAASPFLYDNDVYETARERGVLDKVLFGTDFPLLAPPRYYREVETSGLAAEERGRVLGGNAAELFAF